MEGTNSNCLWRTIFRPGFADKICNLRDIISSPPAKWPLARKQEYFEWSVQVVAGARDAHPRLAEIFDEVCARCPK